MIRNYFKIAFRNLVRNKVYSFINIIGLAIGMAVAMLIGLWIYDEVSVNRHFRNYDTISQVIGHQTTNGQRNTHWVTAFPLGQELSEKYDDFEAVAMCTWGSRYQLANSNKKVIKSGYFIGEQAIDMFSIKVLAGDKNPLHDAYSIVLTDETAKVLFGLENPIGKIIKLDNTHFVKVTAIVEKQPNNSSLGFDCLLPWQLQEAIYPDMKQYVNNWGNHSWRTFVQLKANANIETVNAKIKDTELKHFLDDKVVVDANPQLELFPMAKWRLYAEFQNGENSGGFIKYIKLFGILGIVVLLIACINFMNLSTARSTKRAKEVGIRKAIGSLQKQLVIQFLSEATLMALFSLILAIGLVILSLPLFNALTGKEMTLFISDSLFWITIISFTFLTGIVAGSYPAFYLSSFKPIKVLKTSSSIASGGTLPRKMLVVFQFVCSIALIIGNIIIYKQIEYGKDRPLGYERNGLVSVNYSSELDKNYEVLEQSLLNTGLVSSICKSNCPATENWAVQNGWEWPGSLPSDKQVGFNTIATEYDFTKTMGIKLIAGRDFSKGFSTDSNAVMLNEAAAKRMGLKDPIGTIIKWDGKNRTVIGLLPDLQMESPFQSVSPMIVVFYKGWVNFVDVKLNPSASVAKAMSTIKPIFEKYNSQFEYRFADEQYAKKFKYEALIANLSVVFGVFSILISCLGLFGLASFVAEQRTKEIGVRKVLGASIASVWTLLTKDFVWLIVISYIIAAPIAFYFLSNWLKNYQYRTEISWWVFAIAGGAALAITIITVSFQAIKASLMNPVKSLRSE